MKARTAGAGRLPEVRLAAPAAGDSPRREEGPLRPPEDRPGRAGAGAGSSRTGAGSGSPRTSPRPRTREFMTTRWLTRSGCRAAKARAGWPPMSRPERATRSRPHASSRARSRSAMWTGVGPPGQASLSPIPGQSSAITLEAVGQPRGQRGPDLEVVGVAVQQHQRRPARPAAPRAGGGRPAIVSCVVASTYRRSSCTHPRPGPRRSRRS